MKKIILCALFYVIAFPIIMNSTDLKWILKVSPQGIPYKTLSNDPTGVRIYTLKNGLTVMTSVNTSTPRVQTFVCTKAGSKNDPADATGLAHYLEHMLFKGTDKYGSKDWAKEKPLLDKIDALYEEYNHTKDEAIRKEIYAKIDKTSGEAAKFAIANEFDKMMQAIGAKGTNAFTSNEVTCYVNDIPSNQLQNWMTVEAERYRNPVFRLFHTELEAVYEEKNISLDRDSRKVNEKELEGLFTKHNYGLQTTIGTVEHLKNPSLNKIREYFYKNYVPNNMAVILVGDIDPDQTVAMVNTKFGYMKPKVVPPYVFGKEPVRTSPLVSEVFGQEAESFNMAFRLPGAGTKESKLMSLMDLLLSNSKTGLIDLNITKAQKALSVSCGPDIMKDYSVHYFSGQPMQGQTLDAVKDLLWEQINKIKKGDFDASQIPAIVANEKLEKMRSNEENQGRAYTMLEVFINGEDWKDKVSEYDEMAKITKQEIVDFANKYYGNDYVIVYKRVGEDKSVVKVQKPAITPVEVNRNDRSPFLLSIVNAKPSKMYPQYIDYNKDVNTILNSRNLPIYTLQNTENGRFTLTFTWDYGKLNNKKLAYSNAMINFFGAGKYSADDLAKEFYKIACSYSVYTADDQTIVTLSGLDVKRAVELLNMIISSPVGDQTALNSYIDRTLKARMNAKTQKGTILQQGLYSYALYGKENPFNYILNETELKSLKADEMVSGIKDLQNIRHKVSYYGPLNKEEIAQILADGWKNKELMDAAPIPKVFERQGMTENKVFFTDFKMVQAEIMWLRKSDDAYSVQNSPVISLFNEYFGGSMSGLVFQTIRESKALAYSSYSRYNGPQKKEDPYYVMAYIGTQADKLKDAVPAMNDLLNNMPFAQKSFEDAREAVLTNIESTRYKKEAILQQYETASKLGWQKDPRETIYEEGKKLDWKDVNSFYERNYKNRPFSYLIIGSKDNISMDALKGYGKVKEVDLKTLFGY